MKVLHFITAAFLMIAIITANVYAQPEKKISAISLPGPDIGVAWGFLYGVDNKPVTFMPQLRKIGVNLTKIYLFWQQIEPSKDHYQWSAIDTFLKQLKSSDETLISVYSSSAWATKFASETLPASIAKSPDEYYHFIYELVKHCKGKIKLWQNDSEPNNPVYWNDTPEDFIAQMKIFYRAVKDADPKAKVVMGGYDGLFNPPGMPEIPGQKYGLSFFRKAIKEAAAYFDIFDIRLYANPYTIQGRVAYFRKQLTDSAHGQPIICTEYNGPGFFGFPVNFKYVGQVTAWSRAVAIHDTSAYTNLKNPLQDMYDSINKLAPQTQMFMMDCSKELNDKYDRLQCRDIVMRNILAFSSGVQKTMYWDLWNNTNNKYDLMTLMFGKNKLVEYENGMVIKEYPEVDVFKRMTSYLSNTKMIQQVNMPDKPLLYLFEITGANNNKTYVVWEKRDAFSGEDQPATHYTLPWNSGTAKAVDVFGNAISATVSNNNLAIDISVTPIFIQ